MEIMGNIQAKVDQLHKRLTSSKGEDPKAAVTYEAILLDVSEEAASRATPFKLAFALALASLALSIIPPFAASGIVLALATLVIWFYSTKNEISIYQGKAVRIIAVIALVLGLAMSIFGMTGAALQNESDEASASEPAQSAVDVPAADYAEPVEDPHLSIMIGKRNDRPVQAIAVVVKGSTAEGLVIEDIRTIQPGRSQNLDYPAGTYEFSYESFIASSGEQAYLAQSVNCSFDGSESEEASLPLVLDTAKTQELVAAKEAEKAAAAEAEAAAQREAEAQAAAAAAAATAAKAQAESQAQSSSSSGGGTVYIAASGNGSKYHSRSSCSSMKGTISMSKAEAERQGYTPCKKCY